MVVVTVIEKTIDKLADRLQSQEAARDRAARRMRARHADQKSLEHRADKARNLADRYHREHRPKLADARTAEALVLDAKAAKECARAIEHKQAARRRTQTINNIETRLDELRRDLTEWEKTHNPHLDFDTRKVVGADDFGEAFIWAAKRSVTNCSQGYWEDRNGKHHARPNFYSMWNGGFDCTHELTRGQRTNERSDCSLYVTGLCWAVGLPDPNGANWTGGFTGTLLGQHSGWKLVTLAQLRAKGWGLVIYGSGSGHHVEAYIGEGKSDLTAGHGSAPVDYGTIHLFGSGEVERYLIFDPN